MSMAKTFWTDRANDLYGVPHVEGDNAGLGNEFYFNRYDYTLYSTARSRLGLPVARTRTMTVSVRF